MFQENELVNLFSGIIGMVVLVTFANKVKISRLRFFYVGFALMLCTYVATVVEGVIWNTFFNLIEHLTLALASLSIATACWFLHKAFDHDEEPANGR